VNSLISSIYSVLRALNTVRAVANGRAGRRLGQKVYGRTVTRRVTRRIG
jgi:hypothetical protein